MASAIKHGELEPHTTQLDTIQEKNTNNYTFIFTDRVGKI